MDEYLFALSVSERMFAREAAVVEGLLANSATSIRIIERHLSDLNIRWTALQEKHDQYVIKSDFDPVEAAAKNALIEKYSSEYIRIEAACDKFICTVNPPASTYTATPTTTTANSIKLERVKFRTFDGDARNFPKFKSEFETYVQPLCSPCQLPFVLKSYLCDSVRREVENYDHDISAMWKRLDSKYGTVQKQIDLIMSDFKNLPACKDLSSTLHMIHLVETAESDLKCLNATSELENHLIISYIEQSMSKLMLERWAEIVVKENVSKSSDSKFERLLEFLQHWQWLLEYNAADIRNSPVADNVSDCSKNGMQSCLVHPNATHPIWQCRSFKAMNVTERCNIIKANNACMHCLVVGHSADECSKSFCCTAPGCGSSQHNVLLHDACSAS